MKRFASRWLKSGPARNAAASYMSFVSQAATGILSVPIAVHYLTKEQLGLWAIVNAVLGYLVWMDLGLGEATGRKIAPAVASRDQTEINRWWTLSRVIMGGMGLVVILSGFAITPLLISVFSVPESDQSDAYRLILGSIFIAGISIPIRGVTGLFTAQGRYHWGPIGQSVACWINLGIFFFMLRSGHGLLAYFWALAATQAFTWIYYSLLVYFGPDAPRWDVSGIKWVRARDLLSFSLNVAGLGFIEAITTNLPAILLGRFGGLASIPTYTITARGTVLLGSLVRKTVWSFYPSFLRLNVTGKAEVLVRYHKRLGELTLGVAMIAAAGVLAFNQTLVVLIAGPDFYAGPIVNAVLASLLLIDPVSRLFNCLLHLSGNMGRSALNAFGAIILTTAVAVIGYFTFGMPALAGSLAIPLVIMGAYGYYKGGAVCCFPQSEISKAVIYQCAVAVVVMLAAGSLIGYHPEESTIYHFMGRQILVPATGTLIQASVFAGIGLLMALRAIKRMQNEMHTISDNTPI